MGIPVAMDVFKVLLAVELDARVLHFGEQRNFLIDLVDEKSPAVGQHFPLVLEVAMLRPDVPLLF